MLCLPVILSVLFRLPTLFVFLRNVFMFKTLKPRCAGIHLNLTITVLTLKIAWPISTITCCPVPDCIVFGCCSTWVYLCDLWLLQYFLSNEAPKLANSLPGNTDRFFYNFFQNHIRIKCLSFNTEHTKILQEERESITGDTLLTRYHWQIKRG